MRARLGDIRDSLVSPHIAALMRATCFLDIGNKLQRTYLRLAWI
jgi:hypothetical protein